MSNPLTAILEISGLQTVVDSGMVFTHSGRTLSMGLRAPGGANQGGGNQPRRLKLKQWGSGENVYLVQLTA